MKEVTRRQEVQGRERVKAESGLSQVAPSLFISLQAPDLQGQGVTAVRSLHFRFIVAFYPPEYSIPRPFSVT